MVLSPCVPIIKYNKHRTLKSPACVGVLLVSGDHTWQKAIQILGTTITAARVAHAGGQGGAAHGVRAGAGGQAAWEGGQAGQGVHDVLRGRRLGTLVERSQVPLVGEPSGGTEHAASHKALINAERVIADHVGETAVFDRGCHAVHVLVADSHSLQQCSRHGHWFSPKSRKMFCRNALETKLVWLWWPWNFTYTSPMIIQRWLHTANNFLVIWHLEYFEIASVSSNFHGNLPKSREMFSVYTNFGKVKGDKRRYSTQSPFALHNIELNACFNHIMIYFHVELSQSTNLSFISSRFENQSCIHQVVNQLLPSMTIILSCQTGTLN